MVEQPDLLLCRSHMRIYLCNVCIIGYLYFDEKKCT